MTIQRGIPAVLFLLLWCAQPAQPGEVHDLVWAEDIAGLEAYLEKHPDQANAPDEDGLPPLHIAAMQGETVVVQALLDLGADMCVPDLEGSMPIHTAAAAGSLEVVNLLLSLGADVDARDRDEMAPIHFAVNRRRPEVVRLLIENGADVDAVNCNAWTPMQYAVAGGHEEIARILIDNDADVSPRADGGYTPLHTVASYGRMPLFNLLVENGADFDARDDNGTSPLFWAKNANTQQLVTALLGMGADARDTDKHGSTPLHGVSQSGSVDIAQLLLEHGADINAMNDGGTTPLISAAYGNLDMVRFLLSKGALVNPSASGKETSTPPLHMAARGGNREIMELLAENGAQIDAVDQDGKTALHWAVQDGKADLAKQLLKMGSPVDVKEKTAGRTVLHTAAIKGYTDIAEMLLARNAGKDAQDKSGKCPADYASYYGYESLGRLLSGKRSSGQSVTSSQLAAKLPEKEAVVWYLGHSGWAIKTKSRLLIFDYFIRDDVPVPEDASLNGGFIVPAALKDQDVVVFSSHGHGDHYSDRYFEWRETIPNIEYVIGFRPRGVTDELTFMPPRSEQMIGDMKVTTIDSNDEGVGFLVEVDGLTILHAGDHACRKLDMSTEFTSEIDFLAKKAAKIDLAFFAIRGCGIGAPEAVAKGVMYAANKLKPTVIIPMHSGNAGHHYREFANDYAKQAPASKFNCVENAGDRFVFRNGGFPKSRSF